jgi:hypothetical protein
LRTPLQEFPADAKFIGLIARRGLSDGQFSALQRRKMHEFEAIQSAKAELPTGASGPVACERICISIAIAR